jgi:hypothetical protein
MVSSGKPKRNKLIFVTNIRPLVSPVVISDIDEKFESQLPTSDMSALILRVRV